MQNIRDQYSFKIDVYPNNVADVYELLSSYHNNIPNSNLQDNGIASTDRRFISHITCYRCGRKGHNADNCPEEQPKSQQQRHMRAQEYQETNEDDEDRNVNDQDNQHLQVNSDNEAINGSAFVHFQWMQITLNQQNDVKSTAYKDTDVLINTGSTLSVFKNHKMLLNTHQSPKLLKAFTNGGKQVSEFMGDLPVFFLFGLIQNQCLIFYPGAT